MSKIVNEKTFQSWVMSTMLCSICEGTIVRTSEANRNGVSDITWVVPGCGVFAIELKYASSEGKSPNSKMLNHKLSRIQSNFLRRWAESQTETHAIVIVGTDLGDIIFYTGDIIYSGEINDVLWTDRIKNSSLNISGMIGKSKARIQREESFLDNLEAIRNFLFNGEFDAEN